MEKIVEQGILYDFYGGLLTPHQRRIYEDVAYNDLSLREIAEKEGISKQAVSDLIRRVTKQMRDYEEQLGMIRRYESIRRVLDALEKDAEGASSVSSSEVGEAVRKIRSSLEG